MEDVRPILDFRRLISRYLINNPYPRQDDLTSEERQIKRNNYNDGHIHIKLPRGERINGNRLVRSKSEYH